MADRGRKGARPASGGAGRPAPRPSVADRPATVTGGTQAVVRRDTVTTEVVVNGKKRLVVQPVRRGGRIGRRRYAVVYDLDGPRVRLGILWFGLVVGSLAVGPPATAVVYAAAAGLAGLQVVDAWRRQGSGANRWLGLAIGIVIPLSALLGAGTVGLAVLVSAAAALVVASIDPARTTNVLEAAGTAVLGSVAAGLAGAAVVLTFEYEIGAAVILVLFVSAWDLGDFVIGTGASNVLEGPIAGTAAVAVAAFAVAVLRVPPFAGPDVFTWALLVAVTAPLGQVAASAILPRADARANALRRLDSLLLLAPAWAWTVGLYLTRVGR